MREFEDRATAKFCKDFDFRALMQHNETETFQENKLVMSTGFLRQQKYPAMHEIAPQYMFESTTFIGDEIVPREHACTRQISCV